MSVFFAVVLGGCMDLPDTADHHDPLPDDADITPELVRGATIHGVLDEPFTLERGDYFETTGTAMRPSVRIMSGSVARIDLDGDGSNEATALLRVNKGGSGSFVYLTVIDARDGGAHSVATTLLGDRVQVKTFEATSARIIIETVEHGRFDALCCPTQAWRREWVWSGKALDNVASDRQDYEASVEQTSITGTKLYRGNVVWGHEMRSFKECITGREAWISNVNNSGLAETYETLAAEPYQPVYVELQGLMLQQSNADGFAADFDHSMVVVELLRAEREGFGCEQKLDRIAYRVHGNEPFWGAEVGDDVVVISSIEQGRVAHPLTSIAASDDSVEVSAGSADAPLELTITRRRCTDSMSGSVFRYSATLSRGGQTLQGCAVRGAL